MHAKPRDDGVKVFMREDAMKRIERVRLCLTWNPMELTVLPKAWGRILGEVVFKSDNDHGG